MNDESCQGEAAGIGGGDLGTGAKSFWPLRNPAPLPRVTGEPLPHPGGPPGKACRPEGRGNS